MKTKFITLMCSIMFLTLLLQGSSVNADITQYQGRIYSGTIGENGDQYWDSNEITFYDVKLYEGETLNLSMSSLGNLEVMLCDCSSSDDIEDILGRLINGQSTPDLYFWIDSYSLTSISYDVVSDMNAELAIYSYDGSNPSSMEFQLTTNISFGSRYSHTIQVSGSSDNSFSSNEIDMLSFELRGNERLDLQFNFDQVVEYIICNCTLTEANNLYQDTTTNYVFNTSSIPGMILVPDERIDLNIYIFSDSSVQGEVYSSLPDGDRIDDSPPAPASSGDDGGGSGFFILLLIVGAVGFWLYNRNDNKKTNNSGFGSNTYSNQTSSNSQQTGSQSSSGGTICQNCGQSNTGIFCNNCGNKLS